MTPSKRTDIQADHVIPLSSQALEPLDRIKRLNLAQQGSTYIFPAGDNNVLPDTAFASAMKMMGVGSDTQTAFGMRYSALRKSSNSKFRVKGKFTITEIIGCH